MAPSHTSATHSSSTYNTQEHFMTTDHLETLSHVRKVHGKNELLHHKLAKMPVHIIYFKPSRWGMSVANANKLGYK